MTNFRHPQYLKPLNVLCMVYMSWGAWRRMGVHITAVTQYHSSHFWLASFLFIMSYLKTALTFGLTHKQETGNAPLINTYWHKPRTQMDCSYVYGCTFSFGCLFMYITFFFSFGSDYRVECQNKEKTFSRLWIICMHTWNKLPVDNAGELH